MTPRLPFATNPAKPTSPLLIGPDSIEANRRSLRVGDGWCRTFIVTGYPREVRPGWLDPILSAPGLVDIAMHIDPIPQAVAADRMRRQRARLESSRRSDDNRGRLTDPELNVAADDAQDLAERIARGDGRLFRVGLYITVHADSESELDSASTRLRGLLASLLIDVKPATFRSLQGWMTTLPLGADTLNMTRTFDTDALSAAFPFSAAELDSDGENPILYGLNASGGGIVMWDRFAQPNHNAVILARSGAGKSYLAKLEVLRSLYSGVDVAIVDPENEYGRLSDAVGGVDLRLGAGEARINPFDLGSEPDALTRRSLFLHTFICVLIGEQLDARTRAALDRGIVSAYAVRGITIDPATHTRPAPLLADLLTALGNDADAESLTAKLEPFVTGTHRHLFDGPTTMRPDGHLVVYSLRDLADEVRPVAMLLVLDALWRRISNQAERRRRMVLVDEAWLVMRDLEGAKFLFRLAKSARKYWCGLTVVTQDATDLLGSELGQAVVANAATQILLHQSPQSIDTIGTAFRLSDGEKTFLLSARQGEGILIGGTGDDRVAFRAIASPTEHNLATSNPADIIAEELCASADS